MLKVRTRDKGVRVRIVLMLKILIRKLTQLIFIFKSGMLSSRHGIRCCVRQPVPSSKWKMSNIPLVSGSASQRLLLFYNPWCKKTKMSEMVPSLIHCMHRMDSCDVIYSCLDGHIGGIYFWCPWHCHGINFGGVWKQCTWLYFQLGGRQERWGHVRCSCQ